MRIHLPKVLLAFIFLSLSVLSKAQPGMLDSSFGVNGDASILIDTTAYINIGTSLTAIRDDGKIIIGGNIYSNSEYGQNYVLTSLLPNGSIDSSFGVNGKVVSPINNSYVYIRAIAIQKDGKILLGGTINNNDFLLVRHKDNGELDSTFGVNGLVIKDMGSYEEVLSIGIQEDGKIVAAGSYNPTGLCSI